MTQNDHEQRYQQWPLILKESLWSAVIWVVIGIVVWWLNQGAVKCDLKPRRRELLQLKESLFVSSDSAS